MEKVGGTPPVRAYTTSENGMNVGLQRFDQRIVYDRWTKSTASTWETPPTMRQRWEDSRQTLFIVLSPSSSVGHTTHPHLLTVLVI